MKEFGIKVENLSKSFRIYHEKRNSVYETIVSIFNKRNYEILKVLDNLSFEVQKGEMFGIVGRNGVGKTTLFRLLAGIYKPDSGKIIINGTLIPFLGLGAGFQAEMTARDNVILNAKLLGIPKKQIEKDVDEVMAFAELEKFADTKLKNFSSGMYARLAFSTAREADPDILLMDEILSVGDIGFQKKCHETFQSYKARGKSILLVTHDLGVLKTNCDRAMLLEGGKAVCIGKPQEVIDTYQTYFSNS